MQDQTRATRPTEAVLAATRDLDQRDVGEILAAIHCEDHNAWLAVGQVLPQIEEAVDVLTGVVGGGGHWFNAGAGTSGRLGTLDAAEVPPTFGMRPGCVQAVIAGGPRALHQAVEGAEDNAQAGAFELRERGLAAGDALLAISASGTTPYTLGCLEAAAEVGARTLALTCDPNSPLAEAAEISIAPLVGPEVIAGSTRMKGGVAQKMVLHLLSTTVMVRLGCVSGNLMTHLRPASAKLRDRAERIVQMLSGADAAEAARLLEAANGDTAGAVALARRAARG
jgi:N-acetylmuramic acid 6-phosphate etherase